MVTIRQGEVWWADLADPVGSAPGFRRPVVVVQSNPFNDCGLRTVVCVIVTSTLRHADAPGNVLLDPETTGLAKPSVANITQIVTLDRSQLTEQVRQLPATTTQQILLGIRLLIGS